MDRQYITTFVGLQEIEARKQALAGGLDVRIGGRDGDEYSLNDNRDNRITLWVKNGKVVDAKFC